MNAAVTATSLGTKPTQWQIDPQHSAAHFSVRHLMISNVRGEFTKVSGNPALPQPTPQKSPLEINRAATSIDTRDPQRDDPLRGADFRAVPTHPKTTYGKKKTPPAGADHYKVAGDLTIRGVTREVTFD